MKLPISWLKDYVDIKISAEDLAEKLTMTGLEVESVESNINFSGVFVGEVLERKKHPNADKLNVAKVRVGKELYQIVCGASNLNVGQKVAVALPGAKLGDFEISKRDLRGIESSGMICSEKELEIGDDHSGILVLDKSAKSGENFENYLKGDKVLDIKIFANRPDLMGILGLAREVSAALNKKFKLQQIKLTEDTGTQITDYVKVEVESAEFCPRYAAKLVQNVKVGESPEWLKKRLISSGVRPINNLVDISNYVMLEYGQPLHFFDFDKVKSDALKAHLKVRTAKKSEKIVTLDGSTRKLTEEMLVIADSNKPIALAGVMGGKNTEVDEQTANILIEAAVFDKANIRKTSRLLGLRSEAVARFEKGLPLELPDIAIDRAAELLAEIAQGKIVSGKIDTMNKKIAQRKLKLDLQKMNKFLGTNIKKVETEKILDYLGFEVLDDATFEILIPWWRPDVTNETDLYEEVIRIWGYDKLPSTLPETGSRVAKNDLQNEINSKIRNTLSAIGLTEILTYSFIGGKELEAVGENLSLAPKLENPLVAEQEYLRTNLIPHMLFALRDNQFNKESIKFFEIGKVFRSRKGILPLEENFLSIGLIGGSSWPIEMIKGNNFYELKGILSRLLSEFSIDVNEVEFRKTKNTIVKTGFSADIIVRGNILGYLGEVKPKLLEAFDMKKEVGVLYLSLDNLNEVNTVEKTFKDFSKFPKVNRDLSIILEKGFEVEKISRALVSLDSLINNVFVTDIYEGKPLETNKKSVTFRVEIWSNEKTLTEKEVEKVIKNCIIAIKKLGGEIRGGSKY